MAMNIDKMVEGLDTNVFKDLRGKRIFIGDNVVYCPSRSYGGGYPLKIGNVIGFYNNIKVRTEDGVFLPKHLLVINDLYDKEELQSRKEEFEKKEAEKKAIKKSKVITKYAIALWKNKNNKKECGLTYIPFKTRPGINMYAQKDIFLTIKNWNEKYPDLKFYYLNTDLKFLPSYEIHKKNIFLEYDDDIFNSYEINKCLQCAEKKNKLLLMKYLFKNDIDFIPEYRMERISQVKVCDVHYFRNKIPIFTYNWCNIIETEEEFENFKNTFKSLSFKNAQDLFFVEFKQKYNTDILFNGLNLNYTFWQKISDVYNVRDDWTSYEKRVMKFKEIIDEFFKDDI